LENSRKHDIKILENSQNFSVLILVSSQKYAYLILYHGISVMKRDLCEVLCQWKRDAKPRNEGCPNRRPLLVRGARQVGKTYYILLKALSEKISDYPFIGSKIFIELDNDPSAFSKS
jgi:predicted AAA+ superfamily ATPase